MVNKEIAKSIQKVIKPVKRREIKEIKQTIIQL